VLILKGWLKNLMFDSFKNKWKIKIIETGSFKLDGGAMMGSVPKVLWDKTNPSDKLNRIDLSMRCLLLDNGNDVVLIETGIGNKNNQKFIDMFCIVQSAFPLKDELNKSLNSLGQQLTALSGKFVTDYKPLTEKLQKLIKISEGVNDIHGQS